MDKPTSMSVKDFLIRKLAVQLMVSERVIEAVVNHQFQSANEAMQRNDSVELSGFEKMLFNKKKALKKMEKMQSKIRVFTEQMENEQLSEQKRASAQVKLTNTMAQMETLKTKLNVELSTAV